MTDRLVSRLTIGVAAVLFSGASWGQAGWTKQSPTTSPTGRKWPAMAQIGNYTVLFGGQVGAGDYFDDTWLWDGTNWTHVTSFGLFGTGPHPSARSLASMAYDPDTGQVVLFGGLTTNGLRLNDTWTLGFVTTSLLGGTRTFLEWNQVTTLVSPPARDAAVMEYDPASKTVVLTTGYPNLQDTWSFTPASGSTAASWTQVSPAHFVTPGRTNSAMAKCGQLVPRIYLTSNGYQLFYVDGPPEQLLLFAGGGLSDSWFLSGSSPSTLDWSLQSFASPPQRTDHAMAYYPVSNRVVLHGGFNQLNSLDFNVLGDTWNGLCGSNFPGWAQVNPTPNPGPRWQHAMATGPGGYTVVLFGGLDQDGNYPNDTWTWGRRAACIPASGSEIRVGSQVKCQFASDADVVFSGWSADGFAPPASGHPSATFHTEAPSAPLGASITAYWTDAQGPHSQTYTYTIVRPEH